MSSSLLRCNVHLPPTWNTSAAPPPSASSSVQAIARVSSSKKRKCANLAEEDGILSAGQDETNPKLKPAIVDGYPPQSAKDACDNILVAIQKCNLLPSCNSSSSGVINLDHILSKVPYKDMLKDLFGSGSSGATMPQIPVVTKAYEESFMRQPMYDHEKPCIMGVDCECNMISSIPGEAFIAVEFHIPSSPASQIQMCVLCHRKMVQKLFYDIIYAGSPYRGVIQRYGNICSHENEYAREVCLICPPNGPVECMPFPSVSHQRNKYTVFQKNGIKFIKQHFMGVQDFHKAPPSSEAP